MSVRSSENVFSVPDDFAALVRLDRPIVDAVGEVAQPVGMAADGLAQHRRIGGAHVDEPLDAALAQPLRGHRADAPQRVDRQLLQELLDALGRDHRQAVGLLPRRRDLREELVRRDAGRRGSPVASRISALSRCATDSPERLSPRVLGDVEVGLVERQRLDQRRHRPEDGEDRLRRGPVARESPAAR